MTTYKIEEQFGKYIIHKTGEEVPGKWGLYLTGTGKNGYKWGYDYTYAKLMTLKTAKKHLAILQEAT
jgi:hypothetical protein